MENLIELGPDAKKKVDDLFKEMSKERLKLILKAFGLMMLSAPVTALVAVLNNLQNTAFPMVVGLGTWILLNVTYIRPAEIEIGEHYGEEIKKAVQDERRRQAEEGRLDGSGP